MNREEKLYLQGKPNPFGEFSALGWEFHVTTQHLPRPWVNVVANERLGFLVSHTGSGFTFVDNSQLAVLTRWQQELADDTSGKFLYLRDRETGRFWSLSPAPAWTRLERFRCRHGLGYTVFEATKAGIASTWTLTVHPELPAELWLVELENLDPRPRSLELVAFVEWNCGVAPSPRREFAKLFLENRYHRDLGVISAWSFMWDVPSARYGHWNSDFPYVAAFGASLAPAQAEGDKAAFFGPGGCLRRPRALSAKRWPAYFGRHFDPIAALRYPLHLDPSQRWRTSFALVVGGSLEEALTAWQSVCTPETVSEALAKGRRLWEQLLQRHVIETPDSALNATVNLWARYQAIAGRLWARAGYYQQSGAFGFRDQLQDSQVWLPVEPSRCRKQILLHAAHQFADGTAYHWWHPLTEQGLVSGFSDDYLWLAFVTASYLKETGDFSVLEAKAPFVDTKKEAPLLEHVERGFSQAFSRLSPRGLPLIGAGDWNDGLSACGLQGKGESLWLAHFLALLAAEWARVYEHLGQSAAAGDLREKRARLVAAINEHGWDGQWYWRATLDDGTVIGSQRNEEGRIFLNAQTWAILAETAPQERQEAAWQATKRHLLQPVGALLLAPAYTKPDPRIGYITRYAPGSRENGGVYTHAATWALAAACKLKDTAAVVHLLRSLLPAGKNPRVAWAEPYVLPGNVDGPPSPLLGRAGWTWYTGSAAWFHKVVAEWVCGLRPTWEGLLVDPCLPPSWKELQIRRPYRAAQLLFQFRREKGREAIEVRLEGKPLPERLIPSAITGSARLEVLLPEAEAAE
jgi:cellobiose phosphorylase